MNAERPQGHSMNCEQVSQLLPDFLQGSLGHGQDDRVEQHLRHCAGCRESVALWNKLALIPREEPSDTLRLRFEAMLSAYQESRHAAEPRFVERRAAQVIPFWSSGWQRWALAAAAGVVLLISGFAAGRLTVPGSGEDSHQRIAALERTLASTQQLMVLSMMQQQSSSDRLQAIALTAQHGQTDSKVLEALLLALRSDPNVDVRLASLNALAAHGAQPMVRTGLVEALQPQQSPLVQIELINLLVELRHPNAVRQLQAIQQDKQLNPVVRQRADWALARLKTSSN